MFSFSFSSACFTTILFKRTLLIIQNLSNFWVILMCLAVIPFAEGSSYDKTSYNDSSGRFTHYFTNLTEIEKFRDRRCAVDCDSKLPGSVCVGQTCLCPQGFVPREDSEKKLECFQTGRLFGEYCNSSIQCGEKLSCEDNICTCPEELQHYHVQHVDLCLSYYPMRKTVHSRAAEPSWNNSRTVISITEDSSYNKNSFNESSKYLTENVSKPQIGKVHDQKCAIDCDSKLPGSVCINRSCVCPQGYLPSAEGKIGCFESGRNLGETCNISAQCGEDLSCEDNVCTCPEGFQLYHTQGANLCLLWHRPTRLVNRCRNIEDCLPFDSNSACHKRWCQCKTGYTQFETMLFGPKHKCFKTYKTQCEKSSHCSKYAPSDLYCVCHFGVCHCANVTSVDRYGWLSDKPTWYQRWKKDLILATRLLFITIILFFVPCFVYVTLGVRERSRLFFSQVVQPARGTGGAHVQYSRGRVNAHSRSLRRQSQHNAEAHNVEIALGPRGINSRIADQQRTENFTLDETETRPIRGSETGVGRKQEDPPPSYDEIMRMERLRDAPPPPYQEL